MVRNDLLFHIVSIGMTAASLIFGRKAVFSELRQTEDEDICRKGRSIWTLICAAGFAGIMFLFYSRKAITMWRLLFLLYVFLYSSFIGLVDLYTHNYYLETLPGLLLFIPIGCITWGMTDALAGLLAGICVGFILAITEWLFFRRLSYGGGDTVYGAAASALVGYPNLFLYWGSFALILILAAIVHIVNVKAIRKQSLPDNRFVPLLPWFSILTTIFFAILITVNC